MKPPYMRYYGGFYKSKKAPRMIQNKFTIYRNKDFTGNTTSLKSYLSIITLIVNGLNASIKCHRVADCIKRHDPSICCLQETHFKPKDTSRLKVKGWRTICHASGLPKKAGAAILRSDRLDFKLKSVVRDTEGIFLKGCIQQGDLTIINIYTTNEPTKQKQEKLSCMARATHEEG